MFASPFDSVVRHPDAPLPSTDMFPGSRSASSWWPWPQPVDQAQNLGERGSGYGDLRHLESDVTAVAHDLVANLDQLLPQDRKRPMRCFLGRGLLLLWVITRHQRRNHAVSAFERKAYVKPAASEFQFANVCFRALSGPRAMARLMSASSHKQTQMGSPVSSGVSISTNAAAIRSARVRSTSARSASSGRAPKAVMLGFVLISQT